MCSSKKICAVLKKNLCSSKIFCLKEMNQENNSCNLKKSRQLITQTLVDDYQKQHSNFFNSNFVATRGAQTQLYLSLNASTVKNVSSSMAAFLHL